MKINPYKYPFIAIEGIDGCGKSTLIGLLQKWNKEGGIGAVFTKEPTDGEIGQKIRKILTSDGYDNGKKVSPDDLQALYIKDRLLHRKMESIFLRWYPSFSDRDFFSTLAYGYAEGVGHGWILQKHEEILGEHFFAPDLVLILDLTAEESVERMKKAGKNADYFEKLESLKKIREGYLAIPGWLKEIYSDANVCIAIIDAGQKPEEVFKDSFFRIDKCFQEKLKAAEYIKIFKKGN